MDCSLQNSCFAAISSVNGEIVEEVELRLLKGINFDDSLNFSSSIRKIFFVVFRRGGSVDYFLKLLLLQC